MALATLILRDPRESVAKCSLTPLRGRPGFRFVEDRRDRRVEVGERILLTPDGPLLSAEDRGRDLLLIDCSWRRVDQLLGRVEGVLHRRRLPPLKTAYPRKSRLFEDPGEGLASIEALYAAYAILGERREDLLEEYRWRAEFLAANPELTADGAR